MSGTRRQDPQARAQTAWGVPMPDWVEALAKACAAAPYGTVGKRIAYSATVVHEVIGRSYRGDIAAVEAAVRQALMSTGHHCPAIDNEISGEDCRQRQQREPRTSNRVEVAFARACPRCPHNTTRPTR